MSKVKSTVPRGFTRFYALYLISGKIGFEFGDQATQAVLAPGLAEGQTP